MPVVHALKAGTSDTRKGEAPAGRTRLLVAKLVAMLVLVAAGCGGSDNDSGGSSGSGAGSSQTTNIQAGAARLPEITDAVANEAGRQTSRAILIKVRPSSVPLASQ